MRIIRLHGPGSPEIKVTVQLQMPSCIIIVTCRLMEFLASLIMMSSSPLTSSSRNST